MLLFTVFADYFIIDQEVIFQSQPSIARPLHGNSSRQSSQHASHGRLTDAVQQSGGIPKTDEFF